jgi:hypothetical protein
MNDVDTAEDLGHHAFAETYLRGRFDEIDLKEPLDLEGDAERLEITGHLAIAFGRRDSGRGIDSRQRACSAGKARSCAAGSGERIELAKETGGAVISCHRQREIGKQQLARCHIINKYLGIFERDLALGIGGDECCGEAGEARAALRAIERVAQRVECVEGHEVIGAQPPGHARLGESQTACGFVER